MILLSRDINEITNSHFLSQDKYSPNSMANIPLQLFFGTAKDSLGVISDQWSVFYNHSALSKSMFAPIAVCLIRPDVIQLSLSSP